MMKLSEINNALRCVYASSSSHIHMPLWECKKKTWSSELPHGSEPLFVSLIFSLLSFSHKYEAEKTFLFMCYSIIQSWHGYWFPSLNNNIEWLGLDRFAGARSLWWLLGGDFFFSQNTLKPRSRELITNALMQVFSAVAIIEQGRRAMSHVENFEQNFLCFRLCSQAWSCVSAYSGTHSYN